MAITEQPGKGRTGRGTGDPSDLVAPGVPGAIGVSPGLPMMVSLPEPPFKVFSPSSVRIQARRGVQDNLRPSNTVLKAFAAPPDERASGERPAGDGRAAQVDDLAGRCAIGRVGVEVEVLNSRRRDVQVPVGVQVDPVRSCDDIDADRGVPTVDHREVSPTDVLLPRRRSVDGAPGGLRHRGRASARDDRSRARSTRSGRTRWCRSRRRC